MTDNTWYYGLSTIAQTCGAVLALGGTFVVFRLDKIQTAINNYRGRVIDILLSLNQQAIMPSNYFPDTDEEILKEYRIFDVPTNAEMFKSMEIKQLISGYENHTRGLVQTNNTLMWGRIALDDRLAKSWCDQMAESLNKNLQTKIMTFGLFKFATLFLACAIVSSLVFLSGSPGHSPHWAFWLSLCLGIGATCFTSISVWIIARSRMRL